MVDRISIKAGDKVLARYGNAIGALGERDAARAMARALNRTGNPTTTAVKRALREQTSAPKSIIDDKGKGLRAFAGSRAEAAKLTYVIQASGRAIPLKEFSPRQFSYGIRAKVWGRFQVYKSQFGAPGDNSKVIERLGGNIFSRTSKARLPIRKTFGPALPKEIVKDRAADTFKGAIFRLDKDLAHEIARLLPDG